MRSVAVALAISGCFAAIAPSAAGEERVYGAGLGSIEPVKILELLSRPDDFLGKTVRVEGRITRVCPQAGCWIDITDGEGTIRFKVKDGEIVFLPEHVGREVVAEGVFTRMELEEGRAMHHARRMAEEAGEEFDPARVELPIVIYRLQGIGAVIR